MRKPAIKDQREHIVGGGLTTLGFVGKGVHRVHRAGCSTTTCLEQYPCGSSGSARRDWGLMLHDFKEPVEGWIAASKQSVDPAWGVRYARWLGDTATRKRTEGSPQGAPMSEARFAKADADAAKKREDNDRGPRNHDQDVLGTDITDMENRNV